MFNVDPIRHLHELQTGNNPMASWSQSLHPWQYIRQRQHWRGRQDQQQLEELSCLKMSWLQQQQMEYKLYIFQESPSELKTKKLDC